MKIKVNDQVEIIAGKDKGKTGRVLRTLRKKDKVVIEGLNLVKKHTKPNQNNEGGGIFDIEAPIHVSNVKKVETEAKTAKSTKKSEKKAS